MKQRISKSFIVMAVICSATGGVASAALVDLSSPPDDQPISTKHTDHTPSEITKFDAAVTTSDSRPIQMADSTATSVPEPSTIVIAGVGALGLLWRRHRATRA